PWGDEFAVTHPPGRGGDCAGDTKINPYRRFAVRRGLHLPVFDDEGDVPAPAVLEHGGIANLPAKRACPPEAGPAQLEQLDSAPATGDSLHGDLIALGEAKRRRVFPLGAPPHLERAVPRTCPVQVAQRLLKRLRRGLGQPRKVFLGLSQLPRLLRVTDERAAAAVVAPLLQAGVPHKPAGVTDPFGEFLLLGGEGERVSASDQHLALL